MYVEVSNMLPSVRERKENARKFHFCYEDMCRIQSQRPLPSVKAHSEKNILNFNGDRITCEEWGPILNALTLDKSLHFIAVHSRLCAKTVENMVMKSTARALEWVPALQTRFVLLRLMKALQACMISTEVLTCVELDGLPIGPHYLHELVEGVRSCRSLQHVSVCRSPIGDRGCELLCHAIKGQTNIISVNFSNCGLTRQGALAVAEIIEYQKIQRCSETWKQTLRYREPDLDSLLGLRRITLNHNSEIGDKGAVYLMNVVRDDLFVKALDLQDCGIGNAGGKAALETLQSNVSLAIVDLRANEALSSELLMQIMRQLHINNQGTPQQYHWIGLGQFQWRRQSLRPKSQPSIKNTASLKLDSRLTAVPKRQQLQWMPEQPNAETVKCRLIEEQNIALQPCLERLLRGDCVLVERQTLAMIQQVFIDFQNYRKKVHETRTSGLLDTEHKECRVSLHSKSRSIRITCDKSNQTDLYKASESVSKLGGGPMRQVEMGIRDSASVRDCLQLAEGSRYSDHGIVRQKDDTPYQTVLCKNAELGSASVPHVHRETY